MSNSTEVRCPYCLAKRKIYSNSQTSIKCINCAKSFKKGAALHVKEDILANIPLEEKTIHPIFIGAFLLVLLAVNYSLFNQSEPIHGKTFIIGYVVFGFACLFISRLDIYGIKIALTVLFLSVGIVRIYTGFTAGMSNFGYLIMAMIIGTSMIPLDSLRDAFNSNGNNNSSGCGGGCGSGCGGGCGGCG